MELVALLRDRIEQLEDEKRQSLAEDQRQNAVIEQLNQRESNSQKQIEELEQKLDASDRRFGKFKNQFDAMMLKLGLSGEAVQTDELLLSLPADIRVFADPG